jgi:hypothetical protein
MLHASRMDTFKHIITTLTHKKCNVYRVNIVELSWSVTHIHEVKYVHINH